MSFDSQKYLKRLSWEASPPANLDTLRNLHYTHLLQVPFENLDIHWGNTIHLERDKMYQKIVEQGRGGFCYELNGLFYELLVSLGYEVERLSARVYEASQAQYGPPHDHMALKVVIDGQKWLADVGFGDFIRYPLRLVTDEEQLDPRGQYRLVHVRDGNIWEVQSRLEKSAWLPEYRFEEVPRVMEEFADMCHYHQTDPRSTFLQKKVCTLALEGGRYTLSSRKMRIHREGKPTQESPVKSEEHFNALLQEYFGIRKSGQVNTNKP